MTPIPIDFFYFKSARTPNNIFALPNFLRIRIGPSFSKYILQQP